MALKVTPAAREIDKTLDEVESLLRTCDKKKKNDTLVIELLEQARSTAFSFSSDGVFDTRRAFHVH